MRVFINGTYRDLTPEEEREHNTLQASMPPLVGRKARVFAAVDALIAKGILTEKDIEDASALKP